MGIGDASFMGLIDDILAYWASNLDDREGQYEAAYNEAAMLQNAVDDIQAKAKSGEITTEEMIDATAALMQDTGYSADVIAKVSGENLGPILGALASQGFGRGAGSTAPDYSGGKTVLSEAQVDEMTSAVDEARSSGASNDAIAEIYQGYGVVVDPASLYSGSDKDGIISQRWEVGTATDDTSSSGGGSNSGSSTTDPNSTNTDIDTWIYDAAQNVFVNKSSGQVLQNNPDIMPGEMAVLENGSEYTVISDGVEGEAEDLIVNSNGDTVGEVGTGVDADGNIIWGVVAPGAGASTDGTNIGNDGNDGNDGTNTGNDGTNTGNDGWNDTVNNGAALPGGTSTTTGNTEGTPGYWETIPGTTTTTPGTNIPYTPSYRPITPILPGGWDRVGYEDILVGGGDAYERPYSILPAPPSDPRLADRRPQDIRNVGAAVGLDFGAPGSDQDPRAVHRLARYVNQFGVGTEELADVFGTSVDGISAAGDLYGVDFDITGPTGGTYNGAGNSVSGGVILGGQNAVAPAGYGDPTSVTGDPTRVWHDAIAGTQGTNTTTYTDEITGEQVEDPFAPVANNGDYLPADTQYLKNLVDTGVVDPQDIADHYGLGLEETIQYLGLAQYEVDNDYSDPEINAVYDKLLSGELDMEVASNYFQQSPEYIQTAMGVIAAERAARPAASAGTVGAGSTQPAYVDPYTTTNAAEIMPAAGTTSPNHDAINAEAEAELFRQEQAAYNLSQVDAGYDPLTGLWNGYETWGATPEQAAAEPEPYVLPAVQESGQYGVEDTKDVASRLAAGELNISDLAAKYGVTEDYINQNMAALGFNEGGEVDAMEYWSGGPLMDQQIEHEPPQQLGQPSQSRQEAVMRRIERRAQSV